MKQFWKITRRIVAGLLLLVLAIVVIFLGIVLYDGLFGQSSTAYTNTSFTDAAGNELHAYLARPLGEGPFPAILLIHEWWGLNEGITVLADALAAEGYLVMAADAYRGEVTDLFPRALYLRLSTPQEQIFADIDAALAHMLSIDDVDPAQVASMGFCFGGGQSLQLGLRQSERLAMTIIYYGAVVTDPDLLRPLTDGTAVLGIFAEEDQQIFVEDVLEFETALNTLDIENQITVYPQVGHAFLTEENYDQPGAAGDAWQETLAFLAERFSQAEN